MLWVFLALILASFIIGLVMTFAVRTVSRRRNLLDSPGASGHVKAEIRNVPNTGGIAIMLAITLPASVFITCAFLIPVETIASYSGEIAANMEGMRTRARMAIALLAAVIGLHVIGVMDDRKALTAGPKFLAQVAIATALIYFTDSRLLTLLDRFEPLSWAAPWPSILISVLWLVTVTNAINFMDNMDGLAAGVSVVTSGLFLVSAYLNEQWFIAGMLALLLGSLLAFLCFNLPPASIFMGDGGSLVVGFLLGFLTIRTTYFGDSAETKWYGIFMPLVVLAIPLYDLVVVVLLRLMQGRNPFIGDQQHFSHRLERSGLSRESAVLIICGCTLATGISGVSLGQVQGMQAFLIGCQTILILVALAAFERFFLRRRYAES